MHSVVALHFHGLYSSLGLCCEGHDSQAYRKINVTRERISRILELREILLSFQTGFLKPETRTLITARKDLWRPPPSPPPQTSPRPPNIRDRQTDATYKRPFTLQASVLGILTPVSGILSSWRKNARNQGLKFDDLFHKYYKPGQILQTTNISTTNHSFVK